ncbi:hypothetical protein [Staphylococcus epidermidis]|nr:hypothetical protein [Staphylococcus epidermidis]
MWKSVNLKGTDDIRDLLELKRGECIDISGVEAGSEMVKGFNRGGMS